MDSCPGRATNATSANAFSTLASARPKKSKPLAKTIFSKKKDGESTLNEESGKSKKKKKKEKQKVSYWTSPLLFFTLVFQIFSPSFLLTFQLSWWPLQYVHISFTYFVCWPRLVIHNRDIRADLAT